MTVRRTPNDLLVLVGDILDDLNVPFALGGSMASGILGEPRATLDIDIGAKIDLDGLESLLARLPDDLYVPVDSARAAVVRQDSFNILDPPNVLKLDVFVLGQGLLDRNQMERRLRIDIGDGGRQTWLTTAEDIVLRKLEWFRATDLSSERQWRDVIGVLQVRRDDIDRTYLSTTAEAVGLGRLLGDLLAEAGIDG